MNDQIKNMLTPKGDGQRASLRRMLKLHNGAFGRVKSEAYSDLLSSAARPRHGNETHGTPKGGVR